MTPLDPGLYAAVLAEPESDHPRLVLADWLEENGDGVRAAYIRVRIEWEGLPVCGHDWATRPGNGRCRTCRRKDELYERWTDSDGFPAWEQKLREWAKPFNPRQVEFRRGFVERVDCSLAEWLEHGRAFAKAHPLWPEESAVTLTDRDPERAERDPGFPAWTWFEGNALSVESRRHLPSCIFRHLRGRWWASEDGAKKGLSVACLRWSRAD